MSRPTTPTTPTTPAGLAQFDHLPPMEAAYRAWTTPGRKPAWHRMMQEEVRATMPLLARALDREERYRAAGRSRTEMGTG